MMTMYQEEELQRIDGSPGLIETEPYRPPFRKDYSRLIHASSFRRLQNKTQLFPGMESDFFRNRLTHSLEVAQIATGIADRLNFYKNGLKESLESQINRDLVALAGLAHDLGHPPFGHNGERALDDMMKSYGGFEGNAQTLRILARLEKKTCLDEQSKQQADQKHLADIYGRFGLNLTFRSLAAVLKYDNAIPPIRRADEQLVKGYYESEKSLVDEIKRRVKQSDDVSGKFKTVECSIMDVADDIAYSTYDLEDTLKAGFLTPLDILLEVQKKDLHEAQKKDSLVEVIVNKTKESGINITKEKIIEFLLDIFFKIPGKNSIKEAFKARADDIEELLSRNQKIGADGYERTKLTAQLVNRFIKGVKYEHNSKQPALSIVSLEDGIRWQVEILKHLNYELTIRSPRLAVVHFRGYEVVQRIFKSLADERGHELLPKDSRYLYHIAPNIHEKMRVICDFIAGMTDRYAVEFYGRLHSEDQSIFKPF
jgi:dGTPase